MKNVSKDWIHPGHMHTPSGNLPFFPCVACLSLLLHLQFEHQRNSSHTVWERRDSTGQQRAAIGLSDRRLEFRAPWSQTPHSSLPTWLCESHPSARFCLNTESHINDYGQKIWGKIDQSLNTGAKFYGPRQVTLTLRWLSSSAPLPRQSEDSNSFYLIR